MRFSSALVAAATLSNVWAVPMSTANRAADPILTGMQLLSAQMTMLIDNVNSFTGAPQQRQELINEAQSTLNTLGQTTNTVKASQSLSMPASLVLLPAATKIDVQVHDLSKAIEGKKSLFESTGNLPTVVNLVQREYDGSLQLVQAMQVKLPKAFWTISKVSLLEMPSRMAKTLNILKGQPAFGLVSGLSSAPAPQTNYPAPAPAPAPQVDYPAPVPQVDYPAPAPQVDYPVPAPQADYPAPVPQAQQPYYPPQPAPEQQQPYYQPASAGPVVADEAPAPAAPQKKKSSAFGKLFDNTIGLPGKLVGNVAKAPKKLVDDAATLPGKIADIQLSTLSALNPFGKSSKSSKGSKNRKAHKQAAATATAAPPPAYQPQYQQPQAQYQSQSAYQQQQQYQQSAYQGHVSAAAPPPVLDQSQSQNERSQVSDEVDSIDIPPPPSGLV